MDKPLCRLCGHKHWGDEHVWPEEKISEKVSPEPGSPPEKVDKKKFDRVAYQREYMSKRRAKKRGEN